MSKKVISSLSDEDLKVLSEIAVLKKLKHLHVLSYEKK